MWLEGRGPASSGKESKRRTSKKDITDCSCSARPQARGEVRMVPSRGHRRVHEGVTLVEGDERGESASPQLFDQ